MEKISEKKRFSIISRFKSTNHGLRGLGVFIKTTHNLWIHLFFAILAIYMGFVFSLSSVEWAVVILAIGLVVIAEAFNTAIEIDIDLTSPNYHPYARDTKDVAAGAVSIATIVAGVIGLLIFGPKVIALVF
ncbi:hypothetical protein A2467_00345 [Candidatus Nomurabacteria bacterium RIFOXYC2_FULL_36_8]|nr:MAG: hypothetical protein UR97_C0002G0155 [Candidatus Nomurabacteria bacterium GW2011_GWE2_36_115]KKP94560.1 MAG: hypothetical protein US00_C0001G0154 [Candidatus Nomurabacteria bacterium GW2011_GWF2_36_126]KKP97023.1 MAG: hypothetical protein US04_C0001G0526 [Candidatus Nomurabacteria bacterium GW2011_GWD2_36_14]KKP99373.1 MAG: hypothetical protein US08_C0001G0055 [Candidatus Nomurabacteria bacterium GW2011_GWF2_36_19]KKQ05770.1 MAG: hypothetical protein US17_C0002G0154 [Candidatus Nomuraba